MVPSVVPYNLHCVSRLDSELHYLLRGHCRTWRKVCLSVATWRMATGTSKRESAQQHGPNCAMSREMRRGTTEGLVH